MHTHRGSEINLLSSRNVHSTCTQDHMQMQKNFKCRKQTLRIYCPSIVTETRHTKKSNPYCINLVSLLLKPWSASGHSRQALLIRSRVVLHYQIPKRSSNLCGRPSVENYNDCAYLCNDHNTLLVDSSCKRFLLKHFYSLVLLSQELILLTSCASLLHN